MELIRTSVVGRLALTVGALPLVVPVPLELDGGDAMCWLDTAFAAPRGIGGQVVCLGLDSIEDDFVRWSITLTGPAQPAPGWSRSRSSELRRISSEGLWIRVAAELISGHEV